MQKISQIIMGVVAALTVASCAAEAPQSSSDDVATSQTDQAVTCTPGAQMCDYGCFYQGGPSSSDCIVQCSADGKRWSTITDCGWAENWPYSASCLNSQPTPRCENN